MVFSSLVFLFAFLPIVIFLYYISKDKYKNYILLLASLFFYAWGEPTYIVIMIISIYSNFIFGKLVDSTDKQKCKKLWLLTSILFNIFILMVFKYTGFFVENINTIFQVNINNPNIQLPLGISFFTFQAMSYVIDVYKEDAKVQNSIFDMALYISLFPQLVAGPIVRYQTVADQICLREHTIEKFEEGVSRFIIGISKKVLISNQLGMLADQVFSMQISELTITTLWLGIIGYTLQIFFDFSGYSDMAIGLGKIFGFDFLENFNYPYISKSVGEFWRRWHISLGSWFRDYVYIPLGGNRQGTSRTYINLFIVWFLTGFWHGASWTFIAWGLYFGMFISLERMFISKLLKKLGNVISHIYLILVVMIGWIFFRADNFAYAFRYIKGMFGFEGIDLYNNVTLKYLNDYWYVIVLAIILSIPILNMTKIYKNKLYRAFKKSRMLYIAKSSILMSLFIIIIIQLANSTYNPFLYFRF